MGRDTGIVLVTRRKLREEHFDGECTMWLGDKELPSWARVEPETWHPDYGNPDTFIEIAYWRKFSSVANAIDRVLGYDLEKCEHRELTIAQLEKIQDILVDQLKYPEECEHGFLEVDEVAPMLAQQIMNISWLLDYLRDYDPHAYAYFYDSI